MHIAQTWSAAADEFIAYINGVQTGVTQNGLGTWGGTLGGNNTLIGNGAKNNNNPWDGTIASTALWSAPLSPEQILYLSAK